MAERGGEILFIEATGMLTGRAVRCDVAFVPVDDFDEAPGVPERPLGSPFQS